MIFYSDVVVVGIGMNLTLEADSFSSFCFCSSDSIERGSERWVSMVKILDSLFWQ